MIKRARFHDTSLQLITLLFLVRPPNFRHFLRQLNISYPLLTLAITCRRKSLLLFKFYSRPPELGRFGELRPSLDLLDHFVTWGFGENCGANTPNEN